MRVLYATDGSAAAVRAGRLLDAVGDRAALDITVAGIVPTGMPELRHLGQALRSDAERKRSAHDAVDSALEQMAQAGFAADGVVREGRTAASLIEIARERDAQLIVVGGGSRWIGGRLLGSVSTSLLHTAPVSVLVVHATPRAAPVDVVAGVDGSDHAARAVDVAVDLLDPDRCHVAVVSVATLLAPLPTAPSVGYATSAPTPELEAEVMAPARRHAVDAGERLSIAGFDVDTHVTMGHPTRRLLGEIGLRDAALAVVGARGLDAFDRAMLGSVSDQIVRYAPATLVAR